MLDYNMDHSGMEDQLFIGALSPFAWTELRKQMDIVTEDVRPNGAWQSLRNTPKYLPL